MTTSSSPTTSTSNGADTPTACSRPSTTFKASTAVDITGVDIYHPTEDDLTGKEIAFGGDMTRSTKNGRNYLVLETEAQGQHGWVPFPGQLRLQAYSHLASGADMVEILALALHPQFL